MEIGLDSNNSAIKRLWCIQKSSSQKSVIRGMKLKLCLNALVIILYINYVLYCCCACGFVAMATNFP